MPAARKIETPLLPPAEANDDLGALAAAIRRLGAFANDMKDRIRLLEAVIENFPGGISLFDDHLRMVLCNSEQKRMLDYPEVLFADGNPTMEDLFRFNAERGEYGAGDVESLVGRRMALVREAKPHVYERTRPNGMVVEVRGVPIAGGGFLTTYFDVTEQRRNQALIAHMAHHDQLTNLPNRTLFSDRLQNAVALAKRGAAMAVHYLDIDGFKAINDGHGHQVGDDLLIAIAERLTSKVRENDTVARLGGDEFAVIQTGIANADDAAVLGGRLVAAFDAPFCVAGLDLKVGVSIGIALGPRDGVSPDVLLSKADNALYRSKSGGRGRHTFHEPSAAA